MARGGNSALTFLSPAVTPFAEAVSDINTNGKTLTLEEEQ